MATNDGEDISERFKAMFVDKSDVNILLLGETGVGKSTFINAFANYLHYEKFQVAEKNVVRCLIPAMFTVTDENYEERTVKIGKDKNENEEVGQSATFCARSYVFPIKNNTRIRLIDTPGIGDTRGLDQDNENFENILSYIGNMEYLHAICFLLKPNNSRLTVFFEYCMKQLLSRLEKSASNNIIFLFTNSRCTFYRPGDTKPALQKILDQIKANPPNVDIKFNKENIFCLDNEAFRFMVACKNNIKFTNNDKTSFAASWTHSVNECWRMINYITGNGDKPKLIPHDVKNTISVNQARRIVIQLSQPVADIAELINDNITLLQRHQKELNADNMSMEELKKRLYVPVVNLKMMELSKPTTVCANASCLEIYIVNKKKKYHYKQRCHDPCYLTNVPKDIIGSPELINCAAINSTTKLCIACSCDFSSHMHIYYRTETYEDKIHDDGVKLQINDRETAVAETRKLIQRIELRKQNYEEEKEVIIRSMAKFAHFLQSNAIAPYNDAYKAYLEYLIEREKCFGPDADTQLIRYFYDLLKQYEEEKKILDDALNMNADNTSTISAVDVFECVEELFNLEHTGGKICELHSKYLNLQKKEHAKSTEYVLEDSVSRKKEPTKNNPKQKKATNLNQKLNEEDPAEYMKKILEHFPEMKDALKQQKKNNRGQFSNQFVNHDVEQRKKNDKYKKQPKGNHDGNNSQANRQMQGRGGYNQARGAINQGRNFVSSDRANFNSRRGNFNPGRAGYNQRPGANNQGPSYNQNQPYDLHFHNQGPGPYNQPPGIYNQGQSTFNQPPGNYNQGPGPYNSRQGTFNQPPGAYNQSPHTYNQPPGTYNQPPGTYNQPPGTYNQPPGTYNQPPGPYNQPPGMYNQIPSNYNQAPGNYNQAPGNYNQASGNSKQSPGTYNQGPPIQKVHKSEHNQDRVGQYTQKSTSSNQKYNSYRNDQSTTNHGVNNQDQAQGFYNEENSDSASEKSNNRPMGPYRPDSNTDVELRHFNKLADNFEKSGNDYDYDVQCDDNDDNSDDDAALFEQFARRNNMDVVNKDVIKEKSSRGGKPFRNGKGRGYARGTRGRPGRKPKSSLNQYQYNSESDSDSKSTSSKSTTDTRKSFLDDMEKSGGAKKIDNFVFVSNTASAQKSRAPNDEKKGVLEFFKTIFD